MKLIEINEKNKLIKLDSMDLTSDVFLFGFDGGELDLTLRLSRPGDNVNIYGIIIADKEKTYKINTLSDHLAKETKSRLHIKSITMDQSKFDFTGMIKIENEAQLSDAYLKNDNLVLSEDAKVNSSPQLEIMADDVKASHGVTISRVNEEEIFYLKSRGLDEFESKKLIIYGFLNDMLQKLGPKMYDEVNKKVLKVLA